MPLIPAEIIDRLRLFVPDASTAVRLLPLSVVYALLCAFIAATLHRRGIDVAYTRKIFHFAVLTAAGIVHIVWGLQGVVLFGSVLALTVVAAVLRGPGNGLFGALARPRDEPHARTFILVPLLTTAAGGIVINLFFPRYAYIGYLVCGWGDAVGEPVGVRWGRHRYRVPSIRGVPAHRSIEGSTAVFLVGSLAAIIGLHAGGTTSSALASLGLGLIAGLAGAVVEAASTHGLDNFTVQVAVAAVLSLIA